MHVTGERELRVPDSLADLDQLGGNLEPIVEVAGVEDCGMAAREAEGQRFVVAQPACHLDARRAHGVRALLIGREVDLEPQCGEHTCAQRIVSIGENGERLFQQVDRGFVPPRAREHVTPVVRDGGASETLGVTERAGDRAGLDERVACAGDVTGAAARLREPEEQVAPGGTGCGGEREPTLEVLGRLFVREPLERLLARQLCILDGLRRVAPRGRVVIRENTEMVLEPLGAQVLDRVRDPKVQACASCRAERVVERLTRAARAVNEYRPGMLVSSTTTRCHGFVERVEQVVFVVAGDLDEKIEVELAADHGCRAQRASCSLGQVFDPSSDHLFHAVGHAERLEGEATSRVRRADLVDVAADLADEERIALGLASHAPHELDVGREGARRPGTAARRRPRRDQRGRAPRLRGRAATR